jgi:hypothetical protein
MSLLKIASGTSRPRRREPHPAMAARQARERPVRVRKVDVQGAAV